MVDQNEAYTFQKRGIFYFSKRVPSDLRELYKVGRLTYSLKTKCSKTAEKQVRHSLRDKLRYVACPFEIVDQIGGWSNKTVGQSYGNGYRLCDLNKWMQKSVLNAA